MTLNDLQRAALVLFAAREVGPAGSLDQMKAVCHVMRNRVAAGWYENYLAAIEGSWNRKRQEELSAAGHKLDVNDRCLGMLARDIDEIFYGGGGDEIATACGRLDKDHGPLLYWCFIDRPISKWFEQEIIRRPEEHYQRYKVGNNMNLFE